MFRSTRLVAALAAAAITGACTDAGAPDRATAPASPAYASTSRDLNPAGEYDVAWDTAAPPRTRYRIGYHGGGVMRGATDVYLIWYGNWPGDSATVADQQVVTDLVSNVGLSSYASIATRYTDYTGSAASSVVYYGGATVDAFSHGATLSNVDVNDIVSGTLARGELPADPAGVYIVMASPEIADTSGLDASFCAYHDTLTYNGTTHPIAFVGWPTRSPVGCAPQGVGPNGSLGADAATALVATEIMATLTDPFLMAWYDRLGLEATDKCAWTFGTTYTAANGRPANVKLGLRDYLLPQVWLPTKNGGSCAIAAP